MIAGLVNANREATIRLLVRGPQSHQQEITAIFDTGFTGFLTLPPLLVTTLGLAWLCRQSGILADGRVEYFDVYVATVRQGAWCCTSSHRRKPTAWRR